jgi:hypothetical protein
VNEINVLKTKSKNFLVVLVRCLLALTSAEMFFSKMEYVKSKYTSSLSDMHLKSNLMTLSEPHVAKILLGKHQ